MYKKAKRGESLFNAEKQKKNVHKYLTMSVVES